MNNSQRAVMFSSSLPICQCNMWLQILEARRSRDRRMAHAHCARPGPRLVVMRDDRASRVHASGRRVVDRLAVWWWSQREIDHSEADIACGGRGGQP